MESRDIDYAALSGLFCYLYFLVSESVRHSVLLPLLFYFDTSLTFFLVQPIFGHAGPADDW